MIREKLAKLIDVKSIISLLLTGVFCYLAVIQVVAAELFITIFTTVIAFYFGTQYQKNASNNSTTE